jgi:hypothetical protein
MDAEEAELAEDKAETEGGKYRYGEDEDEPLEESRHTHRRDGP